MAGLLLSHARRASCSVMLCSVVGSVLMLCTSAMCFAVKVQARAAFAMRTRLP